MHVWVEVLRRYFQPLFPRQYIWQYIFASVRNSHSQFLSDFEPVGEPQSSVKLATYTEPLVSHRLCSMNAHQLTSAHRIRLHRKANPDSPSVHQFAKQLGGSWDSARRTLFGELPAVFKPKVTGTYLIQCILLHGLWTRARWCAAHKHAPDVIPSIHGVIARGAAPPIAAAVRQCPFRHFGDDFDRIRRF